MDTVLIIISCVASLSSIFGFWYTWNRNHTQFNVTYAENMKEIKMRLTALENQVARLFSILQQQQTFDYSDKLFAKME